MKMKCPICKSLNQKNIWNDKIRDGKNQYSSKKILINLCINCNVRYKASRTKKYLDNEVHRKRYEGEASIKKYQSFNKSRELDKYKNFFKTINFKNKKVLESNCGGGAVLQKISKQAKIVAGIESSYYKEFLKKKNILYFSNFREIYKQKFKFDITISLGELEHKYDPILFIKNIKNTLNKNGIIVIRVPNYDNIYRYTLGDFFLKDDYRTSHNFYFNESSLDYIFKKTGLKILKKLGLHEYSLNNFISYLKFKKRPQKKLLNLFETRDNNLFKKNVEKTLISTSLLYILKKNV
ncbi:class I SAM-dependent methyltransferase [Candidatus Pelagibacter sp.]|nr:class I SAM-dependent methyltransferase [Candidatus Pelagibacter sp.]